MAATDHFLGRASNSDLIAVDVADRSGSAEFAFNALGFLLPGPFWHGPGLNTE
jgi:hypothetical protein